MEQCSNIINSIFFTLIFAIFIYLRKKSYKKLIELEGKIGKMELKMKKKIIVSEGKIRTFTTIYF
jgi:hypothetical protein